MSFSACLGLRVSHLWLKTIFKQLKQINQDFDDFKFLSNHKKNIKMFSYY